MIWTERKFIFRRVTESSVARAQTRSRCCSIYLMYFFLGCCAHAYVRIQSLIISLGDFVISCKKDVVAQHKKNGQRQKRSQHEINWAVSPSSSYCPFSVFYLNRFAESLIDSLMLRLLVDSVTASLANCSDWAIVSIRFWWWPINCTHNELDPHMQTLISFSFSVENRDFSSFFSFAKNEII